MHYDRMLLFLSLFFFFKYNIITIHIIISTTMQYELPCIIIMYKIEIDDVLKKFLLVKYESD
jgi:hypothetical protein